MCENYKTCENCAEKCGWDDDYLESPKRCHMYVVVGCFPDGKLVIE